MKTIQRLIYLFGGLDALEKQKVLYVRSQKYLSIRIRYIGIGPRNMPHIGVAQVFFTDKGEQLESELTFEVDFLPDRTWGWFPVSLQLSDPPSYHTCIREYPDPQDLIEDTILEAGLNTIAAEWEEILVARGYQNITTIK